MNWQETVNIFAWGLVIGYFWHPLWNVLKKIWAEAKKARKEW
jgi:hypothetical protein